MLIIAFRYPTHMIIFYKYIPCHSPSLKDYNNCDNHMSINYGILLAKAVLALLVFYEVKVDIIVEKAYLINESTG